MRTTLRLISIAAISLIIGMPFSACSNDDEPTVPKEENPDNTRKEIVLSRAEQELVARCNDFAFRLIQAADESMGKEQIVLSPLSASFALSMAANGADGSTRQEILNALGFSGFTAEEMNSYNQKLITELNRLDNTSTVSIANSMWMAKDFSPLSSFQKAMNEYYDADVKAVDFSADNTLSQINQWCSDKTDGLIANFFKKIDTDTRLVLLNALCFKGEWGQPFDAKQTYWGDFVTPTGNQSVEFMKKMDLVPYMTCDKFSVAKFWYGNGAFILSVVLPNEGVEASECLAGLDAEKWDAIQNEMQSTRLNVTFPKLKIEYRENLISLLEELGMKEAFSLKADFSNLSDESLYITKVEQANYWNITEEGTEAATITDVIMGDTDPGLENVVVDRIGFHVTRPFLIILTEQSTGSILYIGKIERV